MSQRLLILFCLALPAVASHADESGWERARSGLSETWEGMKEGSGEAWEAAKEKAGELAREEAVDTTVEVAGEVADGVKEGSKDAWAAIKESFD